MSNSYLSSIDTVIIWIGIWGLSDNIINKYVAYDNFHARILLYIMIIIFGLLIKHLMTKYSFNHPPS